MQRELLQALAAIADLKEENYRLWLSLSTLTEALIARGVVSRTELYELSASLAADDAAAALRLATARAADPPAAPVPPADVSVHHGASPP